MKSIITMSLIALLSYNAFAGTTQVGSAGNSVNASNQFLEGFGQAMAAHIAGASNSLESSLVLSGAKMEVSSAGLTTKETQEAFVQKVSEATQVLSEEIGRPIRLGLRKDCEVEPSGESNFIYKEVEFLKSLGLKVVDFADSSSAKRKSFFYMRVGTGAIGISNNLCVIPYYDPRL